MTSSKILVTGATGFIGARLCEQLSLDHRRPYRALVRNFARAARIARLDPEMVPGNLDDAASLACAVEGCDTVVHLAHADDEAAARQARNMVAACRKAEIKRFVHVSSMAVHGPTPEGSIVSEVTSPIRQWGEGYSDAKAGAEAIMLDANRRNGLPVVVLRPTVVYGPYSFFVTPIVDDARRGYVSLVDGGRGRCNAVYVDDVCAAIIRALDTATGVGQAYLINGDDDLTWQDFILTFARMVPGEHAIHDFSIPEIEAHWAAQRTGLRGTFKALLRLAASPQFHSQLSSVPPVGSALRAIKQRLAATLGDERRIALKGKLQGRTPLTSRPGPPPPRVPSRGRVVREAYRARVANDLAKREIGWKPSFPFAAGAARTAEWLQFARLI